jgi:hypothetical protein
MKIYQALEPVWTCSALHEKFFFATALHEKVMDPKIHFKS